MKFFLIVTLPCALSLFNHFKAISCPDTRPHIRECSLTGQKIMDAQCIPASLPPFWNMPDYIPSTWWGFLARCPLAKQLVPMLMKSSFLESLPCRYEGLRGAPPWQGCGGPFPCQHGCFWRGTPWKSTISMSEACGLVWFWACRHTAVHFPACLNKGWIRFHTSFLDF